MSALHRDLLSKHIGRPPPRPPPGTSGESKDIVNGLTNRVYSKGTDGPLVYLLHGGGHSGLSWSVFTAALSKLVTCRVLAVDMRGHGDSVSDDESDVSADVLVNDVASVYNEIYKDKQAPPTLIMGHSMGGAIAARVAAAGLIRSLVGIALIDVVEGTAMESLGAMQSFLRGRPSSFISLEQAIEWSIRSGQLRNVESARVSMPGQLKRVEKLFPDRGGGDVLLRVGGQLTDQPIKEDDEQTEEAVGDTPNVTTPPDKEVEYKWRIDLSSTEPHWSGWFKGLSSTVLSATVPKMLILAGIDRLDKELTIGQMQGKIQVVVLSGCGHSVHEDAPDRVAAIIANFLIRYKLTTAKENIESELIVPMC